jgi:hypothetical protein
MTECPVCRRVFRDAQGCGGHLATVADDAHSAHRAAVAIRQALTQMPPRPGVAGTLLRVIFGLRARP